MHKVAATGFVERMLYIASAVLGILALVFCITQQTGNMSLQIAAVLVIVASVVGLWLARRSIFWAAMWLLACSTLCALFLLRHLKCFSDGCLGVEEPVVGFSFWCLVIASWFLAWASVSRFAEIKTLSRIIKALLAVLIPVIFGAWLLLLWEFVTQGMDVPQVLLPSPSDIGERFMRSTPMLWADFKQTFIKSVLTGYVMGCSAGFVVAILIDRSPFLKRGLLPVGNLVAALPIVGIAPIMVMWFGFDWQSKAAVVVVMTFFPMLVNTIAGLSAASNSQLDLMKTYASGYWQSLLKLRLPQALPFIFNALKINSTLALIGAIVAEFFGTPIVGMGFRISTEVGKMNVDLVWAEIAVAAVAGSLFYGVMALIERVLTFWHPSMRAS